jgi:hypothetical protein
LWIAWRGWLIDMLPPGFTRGYYTPPYYCNAFSIFIVESSNQPIMGKFDHIITKYRQAGVREDNIEYAILAAKDGGRREHIIENLTADYRGMTHQQATAMLEEIFKANGGEFKKENRGGYWYGSFLLIPGLGFSYYLYHYYTYGGTLLEPVYIWAGAILGVGCGLIFILASLVGIFRDKDDPFKE